MAEELQERLRADLLAARKSRDDAAVTALRTTLAAFANAEAPPDDGQVEHDRLVLSAEDHRRILAGEISIRVEAVEEYTTIGQHESAHRLRAEIRVLERYTA